jgi:hypothetical protein
LHSNKWSDGKKEGRENHSPQRNHLIQDSEGKEENGHLVSDPPKNKDKQHQGTQQCSQKHAQRRNLARSHSEFHGEDTRWKATPAN